VDRRGVGVLAGLLGLLVVGWAPALADALPDGRVWEQVSPAAKNAADVVPNATRTHASLDGDHVVYISLTGFGDVHGIADTSDYMAIRGSDGGWVTHGITPIQDVTGYQIIAGVAEPTYLGVSIDLAHGVYRTRSPLTEAPNVEGAINLYRRDDLLDAGAGGYELLTDAPTPQQPSSTLTSQLFPLFAGASADFSHVVFESRRALTDDAPVCATNPPDESCPTVLYETVDGTTRLVGRLPLSEGGGPAPASQAGRGASHGVQTAGAVSEDGARIVFSVPASNSDEGGELYLRDDQGTLATDDDTTVHLNLSESATPLSGSAFFWAGSSDLSKIFFTSGGQLYRYDLDAPADNHLTLISVDSQPADTGPVPGALGASRDGSIVYFITNDNQLVATGPTGPTGGPGGGERIFIWRNDDTIHEVGAANAGVETDALLARDGAEKSTRISPDGTHLAFITEGTNELLSLHGHSEYNHGDSCPNLTTPECNEVYVYDATANDGAGDLRCASCNPTGAKATTDAGFRELSQVGIGLSTDTRMLNHVLSDDGRFVFFNTAERLQPGDHNSNVDPYEYDTLTHQVHLLSSGQGTSDSTFLDASPDGHDVFFVTRDQLRSSDTDQSRDLYDARIGGVPDPGIAPTVECEAETCRPAAGPAIDQNAPSSQLFNGPNDQLAPPGPAAVFATQPLSAKQRRNLARHGKTRLTITTSAPGTITTTLRARIHGHTRTIQTTRRTLHHSATIHLTLRLNHAARHHLTQTHHLHLTITTTYSQTPTPQTTHTTLTKH
jgi:hypothetical protein